MPIVCVGTYPGTAVPEHEAMIIVIWIALSILLVDTYMYLVLMQ